MPSVPETIFRTTLADPRRRAIFERLAREGVQTAGGASNPVDWTAIHGASRFDALENLLNRMDQ